MIFQRQVYTSSVIVFLFLTQVHRGNSFQVESALYDLFYYAVRHSDAVSVELDAKQSKITHGTFLPLQPVFSRSGNCVFYAKIMRY